MIIKIKDLYFDWDMDNAVSLTYGLTYREIAEHVRDRYGDVGHAGLVTAYQTLEETGTLSGVPVEELVDCKAVYDKYAEPPLLIVVNVPTIDNVATGKLMKRRRKRAKITQRCLIRSRAPKTLELFTHPLSYSFTHSDLP